MWSKYFQTKKSEFEHYGYLQQGLDIKARNKLLKELTLAICNVERKEKTPTVDPKDFQRDMQIFSPDQEYNQRCLYDISNVIKQDVRLSSSVETNNVVPSTHQQSTGCNGGIERIECPLPCDDLRNADFLETDLDLYLPSEVHNQNSSQHKGNNHTITNESLNFSNQYEYSVSSPGSSTQNESSEEEPSYLPSSPDCSVVQTKDLRKKKPVNPNRRRRSEDIREPTMLWEFILMMLMTPDQRDCVKWSNEESGEFIIKDSKMLAASWGLHKCKQPTTYENLSRSLRYYYGERILEKVKHRRLMYRFIKREQYMTSKLKYFNQSYLQNGDKF